MLTKGGSTGPYSVPHCIHSSCNLWARCCYPILQRRKSRLREAQRLGHRLSQKPSAKITLQADGSDLGVSCSWRPLRVGARVYIFPPCQVSARRLPSSKATTFTYDFPKCKELCRGISDLLCRASHWKRYWPWHAGYLKHLTIVTAWAPTHPNRHWTHAPDVAMLRCASQLLRPEWDTVPPELLSHQPLDHALLTSGLWHFYFLP